MKESLLIACGHPDDLIGSAGLAFLLRKHMEIHVLDFGNGGDRPKDRISVIRLEEERKACSLLGARMHCFGFCNDTLLADRKTCMRTAEILSEISPRAIITHWPVDWHVDHVMATAALFHAIRSAKWKGELYFFEETYQTKGFPAGLNVDITPVIQQKIELIRCYASQNTDDSLVRNKLLDAAFRGSRINVDYAEAYAPFIPPFPGEKTIFDFCPPRNRDAVGTWAAPRMEY